MYGESGERSQLPTAKQSSLLASAVCGARPAAGLPCPPATACLLLPSPDFSPVFHPFQAMKWRRRWRTFCHAIFLFLWNFVTGFFSVCSQLLFTNKLSSDLLFSICSQLRFFCRFCIREGRNVTKEVGGICAGKSSIVNTLLYSAKPARFSPTGEGTGTNPHLFIVAYYYCLSR